MISDEAEDITENYCDARWEDVFEKVFMNTREM